MQKQFKNDPESIKVLKQQGRHFLCLNRDNNLSIIAGYPWFGEWGRDTMVSLAGLTISCEKIDKGIEILKSYASYIKEGLLPNTLGGTQGFESYNSIDAGLLYTRAAQQVWQAVEESGNSKYKKEFKEHIFPALEKILKAYLENMVPGLFINNLGFPEAGNSDTQLTWMDATSYGKPVTPRNGSPVEITAMFYNALKFYLQLLSFYGKESSRKAEDATLLIEKNFLNSYLVKEGGYIADVVGISWQDKSVRPNMLFAAALQYPLVDRETGKKIIEITERELLTSCGLRTLSDKDFRFCGVYQGDSNSRDGCYHQGTVWPWLFGIYADAALYSADNKEDEALEIEKMIINFLEKHIDKDGVGFVSEIFDGKEPRKGKGAYAQAWSSAEIIRVWEKLKSVKAAV
jgi:predicted glycogen debranching enzyme